MGEGMWELAPVSEMECEEAKLAVRCGSTGTDVAFFGNARSIEPAQSHSLRQLQPLTVHASVLFSLFCRTSLP